jgi:carboxylesterase
MTTPTTPHPLIKNHHLDGDPFYLKSGPIGILLIHGFTASTAEMRPLGETLHQKGFTISAPLLPGHNTYPEDINRYTWQDWAAEVEGAYQKLAADCESIFVGGESTGGLLSLYLASIHPEIIGVLTYAPALKLTLSKFDIFKLHLLAPFIPYIKPEDEDNGLAWRGYQVKPLKGAIQLLNLQKATFPRIKHIQAPTLIIQGELDCTVHPQVPGIIQDELRTDQVEIHWMESSTHCVVLDKEMDRVNKITFNFIRKVLDGTKK